MAVKLIIKRDSNGDPVHSDVPILHKRKTIKGKRNAGTTYPILTEWINTGKNYPYASVR